MFKPRKGNYFIVRQIRKLISYSVQESKLGTTKLRKYDITVPDNYILYYCDFSFDKLVKGQPICSLTNTTPLFETTPAMMFDSGLTEFINPPPEVMTECMVTIDSYENKKNIITVTKVKNIKDDQFKPIDIPKIKAGLNSLWNKP